MRVSQVAVAFRPRGQITPMPVTTTLVFAIDIILMGKIDIG
jgi:hypothetical protein